MSNSRDGLVACDTNLLDFKVRRMKIHQPSVVLGMCLFYGHRGLFALLKHRCWRVFIVYEHPGHRLLDFPRGHQPGQDHVGNS